MSPNPQFRVLFFKLLYVIVAFVIAYILVALTGIALPPLVWALLVLLAVLYIFFG